MLVAEIFRSNVVKYFARKYCAERSDLLQAPENQHGSQRFGETLGKAPFSPTRYVRNMENNAAKDGMEDGDGQRLNRIPYLP